MIIDIFDDFLVGKGRVINYIVDGKLFYAFCDSISNNDNTFRYTVVNYVEELVHDQRCHQYLSNFWANCSEILLVNKVLYI